MNNKGFTILAVIVCIGTWLGLSMVRSQVIEKPAVSQVEALPAEVVEVSSELKKLQPIAPREEAVAEPPGQVLTAAISVEAGTAVVAETVVEEVDVVPFEPPIGPVVEGEAVPSPAMTRCGRARRFGVSGRN